MGPCAGAIAMKDPPPGAAAAIEGLGVSGTFCVLRFPPAIVILHAVGLAPGLEAVMAPRFVPFAAPLGWGCPETGLGKTERRPAGNDLVFLLSSSLAPAKTNSAWCCDAPASKSGFKAGGGGNRGGRKVRCDSLHHPQDRARLRHDPAFSWAAFLVGTARGHGRDGPRNRRHRDDVTPRSVAQCRLSGIGASHLVGHHPRRRGPSSRLERRRNFFICFSF